MPKQKLVRNVGNLTVTNSVSIPLVTLMSLLRSEGLSDLTIMTFNELFEYLARHHEGGYDEFYEKIRIFNRLVRKYEKEDESDLSQSITNDCLKRN